MCAIVQVHHYVSPYLSILVIPAISHNPWLVPPCFHEQLLVAAVGHQGCAIRHPIVVVVVVVVIIYLAYLQKQKTLEE